ncbi:MAG: hypothetical protein P8Y39_09175 [Nitrospirota bacterium]
MAETTACAPEVTEAPISNHKIELLKVIAHPVRIMILEELTKGVITSRSFRRRPAVP